MDTSTNRLDELAGLMERQGLSRIRIEEGDAAVELERTSNVAAAPASVVPAVPGEATSPVTAEPVDGTATSLTAVDGTPLDMAKVVQVEAPMVGVFYASPSPGAEPFVHVGSKVHKGDTLCVIEAMKLMNEVVAESDGEVVDVCVADGDLVEYGCCLMKLY